MHIYNHRSSSMSNKYLNSPLTYFFQLFLYQFHKHSKFRRLLMLSLLVFQLSTVDYHVFVVVLIFFVLHLLPAVAVVWIFPLEILGFSTQWFFHAKLFFLMVIGRPSCPCRIPAKVCFTFLDDFVNTRLFLVPSL